MSVVGGGFNNGASPLSGVETSLWSNFGKRRQYRHDMEMENLRHSHGMERDAHAAQVGLNARLEELRTAHGYTMEQHQTVSRHESRMERLRHRNAMEYETHRADTTAGLFERVGSGAPVKGFTMGDVSAQFGSKPRPAAAKKATKPRAPKPPQA